MKSTPKGSRSKTEKSKAPTTPSHQPSNSRGGMTSNMKKVIEEGKKYIDRVERREERESLLSGKTSATKLKQ